MTSLKGMLDAGPHDVPRFTAGQKDLVTRAVHAALDNMERVCNEKDDVMSIARRTIIAAMQALPSDRSCATCDFVHGRHCQHYGQDIPHDEAYNTGCHEHGDSGVPF